MTLTMNKVGPILTAPERTQGDYVISITANKFTVQQIFETVYAYEAAHT